MSNNPTRSDISATNQLHISLSKAAMLNLNQFLIFIFTFDIMRTDLTF